MRCRSASLRRRTLAAQSGQYFPRLDLGIKAAPQTAHRFRLPRYKRAADSSPSRGRTATRNQRHMREREMLWTHTQGSPSSNSRQFPPRRSYSTHAPAAAPAGAGGSPCGAAYRSWRSPPFSGQAPDFSVWLLSGAAALLWPSAPLPQLSGGGLTCPVLPENALLYQR